jgi:hypothetical protein
MTVYYGSNVTSAAGLILDTGFTNNPIIPPSTTNSPEVLTVSFPPPGVQATSTYLTIVMNQFGNYTNPMTGLPDTNTLWTYTAGGVLTNFEYLAFTEDTNLTTTPIKFAAPPFVPATNNVTTAASNVWFNGFEGGGRSLGMPVGTYFAGGWYITYGTVDLFSYPAFIYQPLYQGTNCIDLNGNGPGTIVTNVSTVAGDTYSLSFAYAQDPDGKNNGYPAASANLLQNGNFLLNVSLTNTPNSWGNL